jgi:hypothetical protein
MSTPSALTPMLSVPAEVASFATGQGVVEDIPRVLEITRRVFPTAGLGLRLEDAEDAEDRHILVEVDVSACDEGQLLAAQTEWTDELFRACPSTHVCLFRLALV